MWLADVLSARKSGEAYREKVAMLQNETQAADIFIESYKNAPPAEKKLSILLFAIKYAEDLERLSVTLIAEIVQARGVYPYKPEVYLGVKLAKHVILKG